MTRAPRAGRTPPFSTGHCGCRVVPLSRPAETRSAHRRVLPGVSGTVASSDVRVLTLETEHLRLVGKGNQGHRELRVPSRWPSMGRVARGLRVGGRRERSGRKQGWGCCRWPCGRKGPRAGGCRHLQTLGRPGNDSPLQSPEELALPAPRGYPGQALVGLLPSRTAGLFM